MNARTPAPAPAPWSTSLWSDVAQTMALARELDRVEQHELLATREVLYQFSATGHELVQILLAGLLDHPHDAVAPYYRSRPLLLGLGLSAEEALASSMAKCGGISDGRDIGVVFNRPSSGAATVLPMAGDVGSQYTPALGWAEAIEYRRVELGQREYEGAIATACGGDASVATGGFWSAINNAACLGLPLLIVIEDNGRGISVPSTMQTPDGEIARNLESMAGLRTLSGDGTAPDEAWELLSEAVDHVRARRGPVLLQLRVPRLCGHSGGDAQRYLSADERSSGRDPWTSLCAKLSRGQVQCLEDDARREVGEALERARARYRPAASAVTRYVMAEASRPARVGDSSACELRLSGEQVEPEIMSMRAAITRTLAVELEREPKLRVFGEDVGVMGGVYGVTAKLQERFGRARVYDTSLSEEGIIGRALGMALCGLRPVPELQFRKYADAASEQLANIASLRWRTANRFAAPVVVRMAGGVAHCGDPWHSVTDEVRFIRSLGWRVAIPSNAADAVGLLRAALRGRDPTIFFEHRLLLRAEQAQRAYPGDHFELPFGSARTLVRGSALTIVTWGGVVARCVRAAELLGDQLVEVIDLRTVRPWDHAAVVASVRRTQRCLIVHEDALTCGFGAEIAAAILDEVFADLRAPIRRLGAPDTPVPYAPNLLARVIPSIDRIAAAAGDLLEVNLR